MPVVMEKILPASVVSAEAFTDPDDVVLFPEEAATMARAVDKRRREFATGRNCARVALGRLGVPPVPIVRGERGAPVWPPGIVGSITHCDGYRAAAVARDRDVLAVGIDAEPNEPLPAGVLEIVSLADQRVPGVRGDRAAGRPHAAGPDRGSGPAAATRGSAPAARDPRVRMRCPRARL
jgi:4'-phosphopantetheinyl transferase EntD